jgi:hypothetical protein
VKLQTGFFDTVPKRLKNRKRPHAHPCGQCWSQSSFAVIAAAAAIVTYFEERENRQITKSQESVLRSMKETAAAQEAQIKSLDDKIRELSDRQNALAAAPPPAPATDAAAQKATGEAEAPIQRETPKPASPKRASKRKTSR